MDDHEPTPRVGPCLRDLDIVDRDAVIITYSILFNKEYNIVDLLIYKKQDLEVYLEVFIGLECLNLISLKVKGCKKLSTRLLKELSEKPEFTKIILEGDCIELIAPADPPLRIKRALELLDIKGKTEILGYRTVNKFVIE